VTDVMAVLSEKEINDKLQELNDWKYSENSLIKEYELKDFTQALSFVVGAGVSAEKMDHHPDILMHSWNKVKITISTHSEGGVTEKDFSLAGSIESLL
jgi:4a-hydroxytetrahydrobiopterin dehydratase